MMCYRDRVYCSAPCVNLACSRCVTPEIEAEAKRWNLPIAYSDLTCRDFQPDAAIQRLEGGA